MKPADWIRRWEDATGELFKCRFCSKPIKPDESVIFIAFFEHLTDKIPTYWDIVHEKCWREQNGRRYNKRR